MLPILISVSVAPMSFFFCAVAAPLPKARSSAEAASTRLSFLKHGASIVLPDSVGRGGYFAKELLEPSAQMRRQHCTRCAGQTSPDRRAAAMPCDMAGEEGRLRDQFGDLLRQRPHFRSVQ